MCAVYADPTKTVFMCDVKQFLHKVTPKVMESTGAIIPGTKQVGVAYCIVEFTCGKIKGKVYIQYFNFHKVHFRANSTVLVTKSALFMHTIMHSDYKECFIVQIQHSLWAVKHGWLIV